MNCAPTITARPEAPPRCCARCKTPYFCASSECTCHQKEATR